MAASCPSQDVHGDNPDLQTVGTKGLKQVCKERGLLRPGMVQSYMIAALQECSDFSPKNAIERAHATACSISRGHPCLFGVKYHAELAVVERHWMFEKRDIRPQLDGTLHVPKLRQQLRIANNKHTILDCRKALRHCRETMRAYQALDDSASLDELEVGLLRN